MASFARLTLTGLLLFSRGSKAEYTNFNLQPIKMHILVALLCGWLNVQEAGAPGKT